MVANHVWQCEFCGLSRYDLNDIKKHLMDVHGIDVEHPLANAGMAGDILIVSDRVVPAELLKSTTIQ
jgi:hypothetical protein